MTIIKNAHIVNENQIFTGCLVIEDQIIKKVIKGPLSEIYHDEKNIFNAEGKYLIPGVIDDQVHFREPGLIHKADIASESKAAVAGGITSFMEMPNTKPQTTTQELLEKKFEIAAEKSLANYSFYFGATNDNLEEIKKVNPSKVCGIKVFLGSSTGNMLVDNPKTLAGIFAESPVLVAIHSEDEQIIRANLLKYKKNYGENIPVHLHPAIRSAEACYVSTKKAVQLALKYHTRLHILHLSTARELEFLSAGPCDEKSITAEVCVHHLWFSDEDYQKYGMRIKWNPAIKEKSDRNSLFAALLKDKIDVIATDHAPHTADEKNNPYMKAPSGGPLVQHSLPVMLEFYHQGRISLEKIVEKMCHAPAKTFKIEKRGFIREGYFADLVLIDTGKPGEVTKENIYYKCGWSPFEGTTFHSTITHTFVNGHMAYEAGTFFSNKKGMPLTFNR